jgi:hypothetical protein
MDRWVISVSWDSDEAKWNELIAKNGMSWLQYRDQDHSLSNVFGIEAILHYFTIDSDGVLTAEMLGTGSDGEGKLKKLIAKAKTSRESVTANSSGNELQGNSPDAKGMYAFHELRQLANPSHRL